MSCAHSFTNTGTTKSYVELEEENAKLRSLLGKAANHIDALGDPMSAVMIREAIK